MVRLSALKLRARRSLTIRPFIHPPTAKGGAPALPLLRRAVLNEGLSVQTLHIGPYDAEAPTLERLHDEVIPAAGLRMTGHHHEI